MNDANFLQEFFTSEMIQITNFGFIINLILTGLLSYFLGKIYIRYGMSLSNRKDFARNFVLLGLATMLIITIVQSSLALSLGLIGALSIVRFRAAIKEPEELIYLFLTIAIGLGMGANQRFKTFIAFIAISLIIWLSSKVSKKPQDKQGYLTVSSKNPDLWSIKTINDLIEQQSDEFRLRRFDKMENFLEALFLVTLPDPQAIENIDRDLRVRDSSIQIIFANMGESIQ
ncbi:uncharacterized protein METZ01_LOCUS239490 [marine metagenome]|uniref:DUF4956 domain-containing protein n=1 Tax=marine metagenome TaxID=408172 RepID=A0A382HH83_9ZZZZ